MIATTPKKITSHFQRFEFKYHLSPIQASRVLAELSQGHMKPDPTLDPLGEKRYTVSSLYFDSPDGKCFRENESGEKGRFKLRARTYETRPNSDSLVFLEIKKRDDAIVTKDRIAIPFGLWREMFEVRDEPFRLLHHPEVIGERSVLEEFLAKLSRFAMRPVALVRYERIPLVGRYNERFRVTVDHKIETSPEHALFGYERFFPVFRDRVVLEVKFNNTLPQWFHEIIQRHELQRQKFSKYFNSVSVLQQYRVVR